MVALLSFIPSVVLVESISRPYVEQYFRETVLKQDLLAMRKAIDQYAADHSKRPQSLEALVMQGYIQEIPIDPMTNQQDWKVEFGEFIGMHDVDGIVDVYSSSNGKSADGTAFRDF